MVSFKRAYTSAQAHQSPFIKLRLITVANIMFLTLIFSLYSSWKHIKILQILVYIWIHIKMYSLKYNSHLHTPVLSLINERKCWIWFAAPDPFWKSLNLRNYRRREHVLDQRVFKEMTVIKPTWVWHCWCFRTRQVNLYTNCTKPWSTRWRRDRWTPRWRKPNTRWTIRGCWETTSSTRCWLVHKRCRTQRDTWSVASALFCTLWVCCASDGCVCDVRPCRCWCTGRDQMWRRWRCWTVTPSPRWVFVFLLQVFCSQSVF